MKAGIKSAIGVTAIALMAGAITAPAQASADGGDAAKRGKCKNTREFAQGTYASYITTYKADGTSCADAREVIAAYHDCRKANGGRDGRCKSKVKGYKCEEGKREGVQGVQYSARVVCKNGSKKIVHSYTMNL